MEQLSLVSSPKRYFCKLIFFSCFLNPTKDKPVRFWGCSDYADWPVNPGSMHEESIVMISADLESGTYL